MDWPTVILAFALGIQAGLWAYRIADGRRNEERRAVMLEASRARDREIDRMWAALRENGDLLDDALPPGVRKP